MSANSVPSALTLPGFYQASFDALKEFLSSGAQPATAKKCYEFFVAKTAEQPARIRSHWRPHVGCAFNWPNLWKLVRHPSGENVKNDLLWLIIMRGVTGPLSPKEVELHQLRPLLLSVVAQNLSSIVFLNADV